MPGIEKLHLEDALEDCPQIRSLVAVFEQDTDILKKYIDALNDHCLKVLNAQNALAEATSSLSQHLKSYGSWNFPLDSDEDSILSTTLKQFSSSLDEVSSWQEACRTQLTDGMMYPLNRFIEADLTEILTMRELYHSSSNDLEQSVSKFCKIPKRKENDKSTLDANEEVYTANKRFHQTSLHYYANLNALQYKRKSALVEPILGLLHALKSHYAVGQESLNSQDLETFLSNISSSVQEVHTELGCETQRAISMIDSVEQQGQHLYYAEPPPEMPYIPPNTSQSQKAGYLNHKTKFAGMVTRWDRLYFYTLGGHLMSMPKGESAGCVLLELDSQSTAHILEQEERRNVFQVSSGKKTVTLQALNERQMNEWISTVRNISKEALVGKHHNSSAALSTKMNPIKERSKSLQVDSKTSIINHQALDPTMTRQSKLNRSMTSPMEDDMMDTPIQFDMISPTDDERPIRGLAGKGIGGAALNRLNPFDQSGSVISGENAKEASPVWEVYQARFCGSMRVPLDRGEKIVLETIQRIMAARAIHNLFKMCESHLVITHQALRIVDPSHQAVRAVFPLEDISFWTTHKENNRLLGFITRTKADEDPTAVFYCYVFEVQTTAEEVCSSLTTAANIALQTIKDTKTREEEQLLVLENLNLETPPEEPKLSQDGQNLILNCEGHLTLNRESDA